MEHKAKLGQLLIESSIITQQQLEIALEEQKKTGEFLGKTLQRLGFIDEESVYLPILAKQFGVELVRLKDLNIPLDIIGKIPAKFASHYKVIPVMFTEGTLTIAMTRPLDIHLMDELGLVFEGKIKPVLAGERDINDAIRKYYGVGADTIEEMMGGVSQSVPSEELVKNIEEGNEDASIAKFLNQILLEAYRDRATDIHIEPFEKELKVRYRVDGVLYDAKVPANIKHFKDSINARIKILSNLNIAEKRLPQDGRFRVRVGEMDLDLRVSFLPSAYGESAVIRILSSTRLYSLEELGLTHDQMTILDHIIKKPQGVIFLTGPTGSGKTTTLYSCLARVNTEDKKILTIEDPVEYQIKGITQIQINPGIGLSFAAGLRSMLRHDPDIMMVGEIRDSETATIAFQTALTGHLVFSTLHTNDAASSVTRLLDMGVEPYLISSTLDLIVAQRLIRILCTKCKEPMKPTEEVLKELEVTIETNKNIAIYQAKGCETCRFTGYVGREGIYEFLILNEEIRNMIVARATASQIKEKAIEFGMKTLRQMGWQKVKNGITTPDEVVRVTQDKTE